MDMDIRAAVAELVDDLVAARFQALVDDGRAGRLTAEELERATKSYGRTLVALPDEAWDLADVYRSPDGHVRSLDLPVWTLEEGRSDLTLSLSVQRTAEKLRVAIDDLHVL
jgi:hypothetical protein